MIWIVSKAHRSDDRLKPIGAFHFSIPMERCVPDFQQEWKTSKQESPMRKLYVILALVIFCGVAEASKRFPLTVSSIVPGARGHVTVDKDKNGNARVNMEVEFLANPQNLTPPAEVYIVWIQDRNGRPENQGQLKVSKDLKGSFETVTPSKNFELFVTGERDYQVKEPAGPEVLRTTIQP